jgi:8-oxo-dGTP diphosphatase
MHVFVAEVEDDDVPRQLRPTPEGLLAWKPLEWVCDPDNDSVVGNIPHFLPTMLDSESPMRYRCEYEGGRLVGVAESRI